ncbi:hypothetical protein GH741_07005 [Aquibacillus halophilus]|uniref:MBL fold metallo-hydrolase n=1 Tax=Aquibacillus halophilus TaxID=930132 RepID=A0A6A8DF84_9BACI|nr:hypothetical protein [Aquibacillus halophilus]MRH42431.1 hypothetical protein [Aquibacillus halophilus]
MNKRATISTIGILMIIFFLFPFSKIEAEIPEIEKNEMYFAFFNLPDGESSLLKTANDFNILINTGSLKSEKKLIFQLKELSISNIDTLILTKQTIDYCGNAERLIERYNIKNIVYSGQLSDACKEQVKGSSLKKWNSDETYKFGEHLGFKVLKAGLNGSMSLGITYGKTSIMYLSNSDIKDEEELLKSSFEPEILKIGDYAEGNSPSNDFLKKVDPHLSIIFPCKQCKQNSGIIERMNESWIDVYQLDHVGTTIIRMNLHDYEILS